MAEEAATIKRFEKIESGVENLTKEVAIMGSYFNSLKENVEKITELLVRQASYEQQAKVNAKDINVLFNEVRNIAQNGTAKCYVHAAEKDLVNEKLAELTRAVMAHKKDVEVLVSRRDKFFISIAMLFIAGLIAAFFKVIGG